jgi:hypothetical protein
MVLPQYTTIYERKKWLEALMAGLGTDGLIVNNEEDQEITRENLRQLQWWIEGEHDAGNVEGLYTCN